MVGFASNQECVWHHTLLIASDEACRSTATRVAETLDILVVEDEAPAAMELQQALVEMGHMVSYTTSGEGALEQAARRRPDLVVMDIVLKGEMDGVAAAGKLAELYGSPVIFFTARTEPDTIERAI